MLRADQRRAFADRGWVIVPGLVEADVLEEVDAEVDNLVTDAPPPDGHVGHHFYWTSPAESPALFAPLGPVMAVASELVPEVELAFNQVQVALNIPRFDHRPGLPHIDGYAPDQERPGTFTLLAGLLLTDQTSDNRGNLWVWPGTHRAHGSYFARGGQHAFSEAAGYPPIDLPSPTQIKGRRGDVLLAHYLLGHNIGGNYESALVRRALYWRLRAPGHGRRWAEALADPWLEYDDVLRQWAED